MNLLTENFIAPLVRRAGTAVGASVVALGATSAQADQIEMAVIAILGIAWDLALSYVMRRHTKLAILGNVFRTTRKGDK